MIGRWACIGWLLAIMLASSGCGSIDRLTGEDEIRRLAEAGLPATAEITALHDSGIRVNDDPVVDVDLRVHLDGHAPYSARTRVHVSYLAIPGLQPGAIVPVRVDPSDRQRVALLRDTQR